MRSEGLLLRTMKSKQEYLAETLQHWGACKVIRELHGGNRNVALLVGRNDEVFVAKSTFRQEQEIAWISSIQTIAESAGIIVPSFLPTSDGKLLVNGVTVEKYIAGEPASDDDRAQLKDPLKRFHQHTRNIKQRPGFASSRRLLTHSRGGEVDLHSMPPALFQECRRRWKAIKNEAQSAIHGDLSRNNVLKTFEGRIALIDWDESRTDNSDSSFLNS
jgi:Ser/Thr protein kinase RdoA (MazF antagonist)